MPVQLIKGSVNICFWIIYSSFLFVIGNYHPKESMDSTAQNLCYDKLMSGLTIGLLIIGHNKVLATHQSANMPGE